MASDTTHLSWTTCDHPGCTSEIGVSAEDGESASDHGWQHTADTDLCPDHATPEGDR